MFSYKFFFLAGTLLGALGVVFGAFGAHALRKSLAPELMSAYQTGVQYQLIHAIVLIAIALAARELSGPLLTAAGIFIFAGVVLFSGSLYILSLTDIRFVGIITPIGGLAFIIGWLLFFASALKFQNL